MTFEKRGMKEARELAKIQVVDTAIDFTVADVEEMLPQLSKALSEKVGRRINLRFRQLPNVKAVVLEALDMTDIRGWEHPTVVFACLRLSPEQIASHIEMALDTLVEKIAPQIIMQQRLRDS